MISDRNAKKKYIYTHIKTSNMNGINKFFYWWEKKTKSITMANYGVVVVVFVENFVSFFFIISNKYSYFIKINILH